MSDPNQLARRLLDEAVSGLQAQSGTVSLRVDDRLQTIYTLGRWQGEAWMSVPLVHDGKRYGVLSLGPRSNSQPYTQKDGELLAQVAGNVVQAVARARFSPAMSDHRGNGSRPDGEDRMEPSPVAAGATDG